jgi:osmotically-inducible protein OsmY
MRHQRHDRPARVDAGLGDYGSEGGPGRHADETQAWYSADGGEGQERYYDIGLGRYGDEGRRGGGRPADDQADYGRNRHGGGQGGYGYEEQTRYADADLEVGWGGRDDGSRGLSREDWSSMHVEGGYGRADGEPRGRGQRGRGEFRGMGPKGFVRADERIREEVCELLSDADVDATEITVKVDGGEVTLEGSVDSRRAKRAAEDVVYQARGVKDCHNRLRVHAAS